MEYVIDATQAGDAIDRYVRKNRSSFTINVQGTILDFGLNKQVDELCRRIAANPDLPIGAEPRSIVALLAARLMVFMASTTEATDAELLRMAKAPDEPELLSAIFRRYIAKVKLPRSWSGLPYEPPARRPAG